MSKAILMSIQPKWTAKILNGEKTIEVRKKFPVNYVGWVYIYCTKAEPTLEWDDGELYRMVCGERNYNYCLNGKVVARFWCDKVEKIVLFGLKGGITKNSHFYPSCMTETDWKNATGGLDYADCDNYFGEKNGYGIHISKLEIFDKPKELSEFAHYKEHWAYNESTDCKEKIVYMSKVDKAPQSWQYLEISENE